MREIQRDLASRLRYQISQEAKVGSWRFIYVLFIHFHFHVYFFTFLLCYERSITLYIPILCFCIYRNELLLFLCVHLWNRGGDTSIFLNISETGDTMGKIRWHGGKNCRKWPRKNLTNGQKNRCLHPCHTCQSWAMPPLLQNVQSNTQLLPTQL